VAFVVIGVLLLGLWLGKVGPFGEFSGWWVALPFGLAVLWWAFADRSGWTQRRAMQRMAQRKLDRREKALARLSHKVTGKRRDRIVTRQTEAQARQVSADPTHGGSDGAPKVVAPSGIERRRGSGT
jgi:small Trp-rich protein